MRLSSLSLAGHINRYHKLTATQIFASVVARREKYGGGGVHKFRLARRIYSGGLARFRLAGRPNSAAEGSTTHWIFLKMISMSELL